MGLGYALTEDFPTDRDRPPDQHDAARPRHPPAQGRARRSTCSSSSARSPRALRHQGRRRDRPGADGRRGRRRAARRSTASGARTLPMRPERGAGRRGRRRAGRAGGRHARAGLRPPPPLLGAGPGHAGAAGAADRLRRDPRAGLVAARRRPRPRDDPAGRPCSARSRRSRAGPRRSSTTTSRPTPSRAASTSSPTPAPRSGCGWSCAYGVTDRHGPTAPGAGWPRTSGSCATAGGAWSASTPPSPARDETLAAAAGLAERPRRRRAHPRRRG